MDDHTSPSASPPSTPRPQTTTAHPQEGSNPNTERSTTTNPRTQLHNLRRTKSPPKKSNKASASSSTPKARTKRTTIRTRRGPAIAETPMPEPALELSPPSAPSSSISSVAGPSTEPPQEPVLSDLPKQLSVETAEAIELVKTDKSAGSNSQSEDSQGGPWFAIRDIVNEKYIRGKRHYLIDWANDPVTGKSYEKTWIPARDANEEAVLHWQKVKKARQLDKAAARRQKKAKTRLATKARNSKTVASTPTEDSQSSHVNSGSAFTSQESLPSQESQEFQDSQESQASAAPSSPAPSRTVSRKRRSPSSEKENTAEAAPRKRRLVQGIRPGKNRPLEPVQSESSAGPDLSQSLSVSQDQDQDQAEDTKSPELSILSSHSPLASREQSIQQDIAEFGSQEPLVQDAPVPTATATVESVDIVPRPGFDPSEYARLSQENPSSRELPQAPLQSQQSLPFSSQDEEEDPARLPSGHTIPDSQQEEFGTLQTATASDDSQPLFVDQIEDSSLDPVSQPAPAKKRFSQFSIEFITSPSVGQQSPSSDIPSIVHSQQQQARQQSHTATRSTTSGDAQIAPPSLAVQSQSNEQLRASADWASEEEQVFAPVQDSADKSTASGSRSQTLNFLTQPEPDFPPFTQESQPATAKTPVASSATDSNNFSAVSVVPDSTRPFRTTAPNAAQIAEEHYSSISLPSSAQFVPYSHGGTQDSLLLNTPAVFSVPPRPRTPTQSQDSYRSAPIAVMAESPNSPPGVSYAAMFQKVIQDHMDSLDNTPYITEEQAADPIFMAEYNRLQAEMEAKEKAGGSSEQPQEASQESVVSTSSNVLPIPALSQPQTDPLLETGVPLTTSALDASLPLLLSPTAAGQGGPIVSDAQHIGGAIEDISNVHPGTIAPGDLSFTDADPMASSGLDLSPEPEPEHEPEPEPEFPSEDAGEDDNEVEAEQLPMPIAMDEDANVEDEDEDDLSSLSNPNYTTSSYVVTLPLAANTRQYYADFVVKKESQEAIKEYSEAFSRDIFEMPSSESIARVDEILRTLIDFSDLPTFPGSLPPLDNETMTKHALDTNSKFLFLYEFLESISTVEKEILILVRKGMAFDNLKGMLSYADIPFERFQAGSYVRPSRPGKSSAGSEGSDKPEARRHRRSGMPYVLLADTTEMSDAMRAASPDADDFPKPADFDIVIGFDHTARTTGLMGYFQNESESPSTSDAAAENNSRAGNRNLPKPIALLLVCAWTLEHIDLRLERNSVDNLERRNALLLCTLESLSHLRDNPYEINPAKPHEAAQAFAQMIREPNKALAWETTPLPEEVFDIYMNSSGAASQPTFTQEETIDGGLFRSRKRQLDDDDEGEDSPKRMRLADAVTPIVRHVTDHYNDVIQFQLDRLDVRVPDDAPRVQISVPQLEALASKVAFLSSMLETKTEIEASMSEHCRSLGHLNKSTTATINDVQKKLIAAVKERSAFERERDAAVKEAASTKEKLEARNASLTELRAEKKALETRVAETDALLAGSSQPDAAELGAARVALKEAQDKAATLERKVANADTDLAHARRAYQDASNAAADLSTENRDLKARIRELERLSSDNLRQIRQTQNQNETEYYRKQWDEARTMLNEREHELEFTRDELRILKNGRRETRQQSVPRSPRLSVISPRTISGRGGSVGVGPNGGSSSASVTPAPNMGAGQGFAVTARASVSRGNSPVSANFDPSVHGGVPGGSGGNGGSGAGGGPPVAGMTYLNSNQGGGRWQHLRD